MKIGNIDIKKAYFGNKELSNTNAFLGTVSVIDAAEPQLDGLCFTAREATTISMVQAGTDSRTYDLSTSKNGVKWTSYTLGTNITLAAGEKLYWKGNNTSMATSSSIYKYFTTTGKVDVSGNIMSILGTDTLSSYAYAYLFKGSKIVNANELLLPATTLATSCYYSMFYQCTSLVTAPVLPATTLVSNCYGWMFQRCTSLTTTPVLPATTLATGCYSGMFNNCTSLVNAPELPATTLANSCYYSMFQNCTSLVNAPELPATTLANSCYYSMFYNCSSLVNAPELPATTLASQCYTGMFSGCTSLVNAPSLPVTTLQTNCYSSMFSGCTSLTTAPSLPATKLATYCYNALFKGCTSLETAPELPATTLANDCYEQMFQNCTSLTTAPALPATTLAASCYSKMFYGCSKLNKITVGATSWEYGTSNWVNGVAATGDFYNLGGATIPTGTSGIPTGWTQHDKLDDFLCFTAKEATNISMVQTGTDSRTYDLSTSTDGLNWTKYTLGTNISLSTGKKLYWKGNNTSMASSTTAYKYFTTSGKVDVSGNIMSLLGTDTLANYAFYYLFRNAKVVNANELLLTADELALSCYTNMFYGCTSLETAPELPATTLANSCYNAMFYGCTSLVNAPALPATTLANSCYMQMFEGCSALETSPTILPATTLQTDCYRQMFAWCAALTTAPELPATTLADYCYTSMFSQCAALTTAPELPAIELASNCYQNMFNGCTSLTTAPALPATTLVEGCYDHMFMECSSLSSITTYAISWNTDNTCEWLYGVAETGDFYNYGGASIIIDTDGIPEGWTEHKSDTNYFKITALSDNTYLQWFANEPDTKNLEYSTDASVWNTIECSSDNNWSASEYNNFITLNTGESVYVRGKNPDGLSVCGSATSNKNVCALCGAVGNKIKVSGDLMTLVDYENPEIAMPDNYCFIELLQNTSGVVDASELTCSATELGKGAFYRLFRNCSYLTSFNPELLRYKTLKEECYCAMFENCSVLHQAINLPASQLVKSCYEYMFSYCSLIDNVTCMAVSDLNEQVSYRPAYSDSWMQYVSETGTFTKLSINEIPIATYGIPDGWTINSVGSIISNTEYTFECTEGSSTLYITSDCDWTIEPTDEWISVSKTEGTGNDSVIISVMPNEITEKRTGSVIFTDEYCEIQIAINQKKYAPAGSWEEIEPTKTSEWSAYTWSGDAGLVKVEFSADDTALTFNDAVGNSIQFSTWAGATSTGIEYEDEGDNVYICTFNETWEAAGSFNKPSTKVYWKANS